MNASILVIDCLKHGRTGPLATSVRCGKCAEEDKAEIEHLRAYQQQMNDILKENERLRKQLSARLQELERIKQKRLDWAMLCDHDCPTCTELDDAIRGDVPQTAEHAASRYKP